MDDPKDNERATLTLVADNSSVALEMQRNQRELEYAKLRASSAIRQLAVNLLRIIAGAGEPWALLKNIDEARTAYLSYSSSAKEVGHPFEPPTRELDLNHLFSFERRERAPVTQEDWQRWALPRNPYEDYLEEKSLAKLGLRRAALRQIASVLSSGEHREPHLKAHGGNLDDIIESILATQKRHEKQRSQPTVARSDPKKREIADQKIAEIHLEKRQRQLESLPPHHVAGLRAVRNGMVDQIDAFTLDVLGRINLLTRPKGIKKKSAWQLTEDGKLALDIHDPKSKP